MNGEHTCDKDSQPTLRGWSLAYGGNNIFGMNGSYDPIAIINTPSV